MTKLAVIGCDVDKSLSPALHSFLFRRFGERCNYEKISIPPEHFEREVKELFKRLDGFNVTIPYKEAIVPYLKEVVGAAARLKAVNTVLCKGRRGENTDFEGFSYMLREAGIDPRGMCALVIGAGGAGRSCAEKLKELDAEVSLYGKYPDRLRRVHNDLGGFTPLTELSGTYDIVVNCSGIGMGSTEGMLPTVRTCCGEQAFSSKGCRYAIDLIYEPQETAFLKEAASHGAKILCGSSMLFFQAYLSDCIYLGRDDSFEEAQKLYHEYLGGNL